MIYLRILIEQLHIWSVDLQNVRESYQKNFKANSIKKDANKGIKEPVYQD